MYIVYLITIALICNLSSFFSRFLGLLQVVLLRTADLLRVGRLEVAEALFVFGLNLSDVLLRVFLVCFGSLQCLFRLIECPLQRARLRLVGHQTLAQILPQLITVGGTQFERDML